MSLMLESSWHPALSLLPRVPARVLARLVAPLLALAMLLGVPAGASAQMPDSPVTVSAKPFSTQARQGDRVPIAIIFEHAEKFHTWPNKPTVPPELAGLEPIVTQVQVDTKLLPPGVRVYPASTQWPATKEVRVAFGTRPIMIPSYAGRAVAFVPVEIASDAPLGRVSIPLTFSYQACDDMTCFPEEIVPLQIEVEIVASTAPAPASTDAALFAAFDPSVWSRLSTEQPTPPAGQGASAAEDDSAQFDFLGARFSVRRDAYVLIFAIAFVAGFLLNLTPCVLPVIPIKILSLQQQAKNPAKLAMHGLVYCLGIVVTFGVLGLLLFGLLTGGQKQDWGQIFTNKWFTIAMALIVGVMGVGMMGLFTIKLPQSVYMLNPSHDSVHGNFLMGVLTAVLSTPCTGPLLGATIAWAATRPPGIALGTLVTMGLGMAFPYALLIAFPKLIDRMPRSGPGGELLKQVMGIILVAVAIFLAGNLTPAKWPWYAIGAVAAAGWIWSIVGGLRVLRTPRAKAINAVFSLGALVLTIWIVSIMIRPGPIPWAVFANVPEQEIRDRVKKELAEGRSVVIDFTAKWCTNCIVIERTILNSETGRRLLNSPGTVPIKVDLTSAKPDQGWGVVREIAGGGGIPLIAIYVPGREKPTYFQSFFAPSDLEEALKPGVGR